MRTPWILFVSLLMISSCSNPQSDAKKQINKKQYRFQTDDFLFAAGRGDLPVLILFGKAGIEINTADTKGKTALMESSRKGKLEAVRLLLGAGADARIEDQKGRDALIFAAAGGYSEIGRLLLSRGADPTVRDHDDWTALSIAAHQGKAEMVRLIAAQSDQENLDEALLLGAVNGHKDTVANLLSQGAAADSKSPDQMTPLMLAAKSGNFEVAHLLLQNRANPFSISSDGKNAAQIAKAAGHHNIYRLIIDRGVMVPPPDDPKSTKPLVALNRSKIRTRTPKHNALHQFQLTHYAEHPLPVSLKEVDGIYAIVSRLDRRGNTTDIKIASTEIIPGTNYRLQQIESRKIRSNGLPENTIDTTRVRIQNTKTGSNHLLVKGDQSNPIDSYAILTSPSSDYRYVAKTGDIFQTIDPGHGERDYQVIGISDRRVSVKELATQETILVDRTVSNQL